MLMTPRRLSTLMLSVLMSLMLLVTPIGISSARATSVVQMDFYEVLANAELVFEGRVVHVEAQQTGPRSIHTLVRFEILSVLKGEYRQSTLELSYLGGTVGTRVLEVQSMQIPALGEHGFYFVESLHEPLVHPLTGWSQGHFLIEPDAANQPRVHTAAQQPVTAIVAAPTAPAPAMLGHDGSSRGVVVQNPAAPTDAISAEQFRQLVRQASAATGVRP